MLYIKNECEEQALRHFLAEFAEKNEKSLVKRKGFSKYLCFEVTYSCADMIKVSQPGNVMPFEFFKTAVSWKRIRDILRECGGKLTVSDKYRVGKSYIVSFKMPRS